MSGRPPKSILKAPNTPTKERKKSARWDEDNIRATLHPEGKDYGLMKIDEAKTPYNWSMPPSEKDSPSTSVSPFDHGLDADLLEQKLQNELKTTIDREKRRKLFEEKRKAHYNEFKTWKSALALLQLDDDEDEGEDSASKGKDNKAGKAAKNSVNPQSELSEKKDRNHTADISITRDSRVIDMASKVKNEPSTSRSSKVAK